MEQPGEIAAQNFHLGGRTVLAQLGGQELRRDSAPRIDPGGPLLACPGRQRGFLQPHFAQHLSPDAAHIDILAAIAKGRRAFDHSHVPAGIAQPPGQRIAGDARPGDQNLARHPRISFARDNAARPETAQRKCYSASKRSAQL